MLKFLPLYLLAGLTAFALSSCATGKRTALPSRNVITVAKSGAIRLDDKPISLKELPIELKSRGVQSKFKITLEGEQGTSQQDIERVLESLVANGLLPKDTID